MKDPTILYTLLGLLTIAGFYCLGEYLRSPYRRMRLRRKIACLFGRHTPGPVKAEVGGRNVQRCDWCDRVIREFTVTKKQAEDESGIVRRIY